MLSLFVSVVWIGVLGQSLSAQQCPPPRLSSTSLQLWSENVVTVESQGRKGYGLVVGWKSGEGGRQNGEAWVAIPGHVLYGDVAHPDLSQISAAASTIRLTLSGADRPGALCPREGEPFNPTPPDPDADLAFACVQWAGRPLFWSSLIPRQVHVGAETVLLVPDAGELGRGKVTTISTDTILTFPAIGEFGMSGGPVAAPSGVIGEYLGKDDSGRVLNISRIQRSAELAQVPWELVEHEFYDCQSSRRVCRSIQTELTPASLELRGTNGELYRLTGSECADIVEDKYQVVDPAGVLNCEPSHLSVLAADVPLSLTLQCRPNLSGVWTTADGHTLTCVATLPLNISARCAGLEGMGRGLLQVTLRPGASGITFDGAFYDPVGNAHEVTGILRWESGLLAGELQREGYPPEPIVLTRRKGP